MFREKLGLVWIILELAESWFELSQPECIFSQNTFSIPFGLFTYSTQFYLREFFKKITQSIIKLFIHFWVSCSADLSLSWSCRAGERHSTVKCAFSHPSGPCMELRDPDLLGSWLRLWAQSLWRRYSSEGKTGTVHDVVPATVT